MPPKTLLKAGGVAFLLAVVSFSLGWYWFDTRTFEPVNVPVQFEAGKTQTVEFPINLQDDYSVRILVDYSLDDWAPGKCSDKLWQEADWKVYRLDGRSPNVKELWASSEEMRKQGLVPDGFHGSRGRYKLEWSVPNTAVCLNPRHPQLRVWADSSPYETGFAFVLIACIATVMAGSGALLRAMVLWLPVVLRGSRIPRIFPDMAITNVIRLRPHRPMPLISVLPDFRTAWFCIIGVLTVLFCLFLTRWGWQPTGLPVDFKLERSVIVEKNPWAETMAVYVDAKRGFFVNGKEVPREELRSKLEEELQRRGVWVVYFEADGNCLYMDAVHAIDTIQGLGAKLIWITPKMREEWKQSAIPKYSERTAYVRNIDP
jgi:biopolymer transport protein ExbD